MVWIDANNISKVEDRFLSRKYMSKSSFEGRKPFRGGEKPEREPQPDSFIRQRRGRPKHSRLVDFTEAEDIRLVFRDKRETMKKMATVDYMRNRYDISHQTLRKIIQFEHPYTEDKVNSAYDDLVW